MEFNQFETVSTVYGSGYIANKRSDCSVVHLTNWLLAQHQSPVLYLQYNAIKRIPGCFPGSTVKTPYGIASVESIRADGVHVVKPINWKLANNSVATLFLQPSQVQLIQTPGFNEGDEVMTVYGRGYIEKKREHDYIVKLYNWKLAQGQSPTLYLNESSLVKIHKIDINDVAKTVYGLVKIEDIRRDGTHVCRAIHWKLANNESPILYLAPEAFALMSIKP